MVAHTRGDRAAYVISTEAPLAPTKVAETIHLTVNSGCVTGQNLHAVQTHRDVICRIPICINRRIADEGIRRVANPGICICGSTGNDASRTSSGLSITVFFTTR